MWSIVPLIVVIAIYIKLILRIELAKDLLILLVLRKVPVLARYLLFLLLDKRATFLKRT